MGRGRGSCVRSCIVYFRRTMFGLPVHTSESDTQGEGHNADLYIASLQYVYVYCCATTLVHISAHRLTRRQYQPRSVAGASALLKR
jgi:hypothetical protein